MSHGVQMVNNIEKELSVTIFFGLSRPKDHTVVAHALITVAHRNYQRIKLGSKEVKISS